ncbi:MAG TPA: efflux RND transporter periplasmic adaptor subunit [Planctomycetota bacterium]|jgi:cobalt-zinc-cadmium efflux system membrane fusion protein
MKGLNIVVCSVILACFVLAAADQDAKSAASGKPQEAPGTVKLSPESLKAADLEVAAASPGVIARMLEATGEIALNEDKLAHLTPRIPGSVVQVLKSAGDKVAAGEVLAVLQSTELGKAKIEFLSTKQALELAQMDVEREKTIHDNTAKLLELLKSGADAQQLEKLGSGQIGENKAKLLTAYAALRLAKSACARSQKLRTDQLASEASYEVCVKELESAQAEFQGVFEEVSFNHKQRLAQATRALRLAEIAHRNADRYLHILGVEEKELAELPAEHDVDIARYVLRAPFAGTVIEKHITNGEHLKEDVDCFVIADLATVWANVSVYTRDLGDVAAGQPVQITIPDREGMYAGKINMLSPLVHEKTRTATVRSVFDNAAGALKPGLFVTARIVLGEINAPVVVPVSALLIVKSQSMVFVQGDQPGEFVMKEVKAGISDGKSVEIKDGLKPGTKLVVKNAFTLRSELEKQGFDAD